MRIYQQAGPLTSDRRLDRWRGGTSPSPWDRGSWTPQPPCRRPGSPSMLPGPPQLFNSRLIDYGEDLMIHGERGDFIFGRNGSVDSTQYSKGGREVAHAPAERAADEWVRRGIKNKKSVAIYIYTYTYICTNINTHAHTLTYVRTWSRIFVVVEKKKQHKRRGKWTEKKIHN